MGKGDVRTPGALLDGVNGAGQRRTDAWAVMTGGELGKWKVW